MPKYKVSDLNDMYTRCESADYKKFSEMRSNVRLTSAEHYSRRGLEKFRRLQSSRGISSEQKIRITKNHLFKITNIIKNNILTYAPGVSVYPANDTETQDIKAAQLCKAVWEDIKRRHKIRGKIRDWCADFVEVGECAVKVIWDYNAGDIVRNEMGEPVYEQAMNDDGEPMLDPEGKPMKSEKVIRTGDFVFERVYGFNLLVDSSAPSNAEARYMIVRKMRDVKELKAAVQDANIANKIQETPDETYKVFNDFSGEAKDTKGLTLVKEFYFRPCNEYPEGYFFITTGDVILSEGPLPMGLWPIHWVGYEESPTARRASSVIKNLRPIQAEINRMSSSIVSTQLQSGFDTVLIQAGTKIANGGMASGGGVRAITYTGMAPTVLPGRTGDQFLPHLEFTISEMYEIANVPEDNQEKNAQMDPMSHIMMSASQRKKFVIYSEKFEEFITNIAETTLRLAKEYYDDNRLVPAIGAREFINVAEFRDSEDLGYQVRLEPQTDDAETKMAKYQTIQQILQYAGQQITPEQIAVMIANHPYMNHKEMSDEFTMDYENAKNIMLQLDRGEMPHMFGIRYEKHAYLIGKLTNRTRKGDFQFLDPQIQQNYDKLIQELEQIEVQKQEEIRKMQAGLIPVSEKMTKVDYYEMTEDGKQRRIILPVVSIEWLLERLKEQGSYMAELEGQGQNVQADIAGMLGSGSTAGGHAQGSAKPPQIPGGFNGSN